MENAEVEEGGLKKKANAFVTNSVLDVFKKWPKSLGLQFTLS